MKVLKSQVWESSYGGPQSPLRGKAFTVSFSKARQMINDLSFDLQLNKISKRFKTVVVAFLDKVHGTGFQ